MADVKNLINELEVSELKRLRMKRQSLLEGCEPDDPGLWIMLDVMTLILAFFIMLYSNQVQIAKKIHIRSNTVEVHQETADNKVLTPVEPAKKTHDPVMDLLLMEDQLHQVMDKSHLSDYSVKIEKNRLVLTLGEDISFPSGQATLLNYIKPALKDMAVFFNTAPDYRIIVAGHTDNTPIHTDKFPSNWELSAARALSVATFFIECQVSPERINIEGYGEYRPIGDNNYFLGREANRRVEISLVKKEMHP